MKKKYKKLKNSILEDQLFQIEQQSFESHISATKHIGLLFLIFLIFIVVHLNFVVFGVIPTEVVIPTDLTSIFKAGCVFLDFFVIFFLIKTFIFDD